MGQGFCDCQIGFFNDDCGNELVSVASVEMPVLPEEDSRVVAKTSDGLPTFTAAVSIPSGALRDATRVSVGVYERTSAVVGRIAGAATSAGLTVSGEVVQFGPKGLKFDKAAKIEVAYDAGANPDALAVYYFNKKSNVWERQISWASSAGRIAANITHFSLFTVMQATVEIAAPEALTSGSDQEAEKSVWETLVDSVGVVGVVSWTVLE